MISPEQIRETILECSSNSLIDKQLFNELLYLISRADDEIIVEGIISVIEMDAPISQRVAGRIFDEFCPISGVSLNSVLNRVISNWDKSIDSLPFWFVDNYGKETVISEIETNLKITLDKKISSNLNTLLWWINKVNAREGRIW